MSIDYLAGQSTQIPVTPGTFSFAAREAVFSGDNVVIDVVQPGDLFSLHEKPNAHKELISGKYFDYVRLTDPGNRMQIVIANSAYGAPLPINRDTVIDQRKELNTILLNGMGNQPPLVPTNIFVNRFTLLLDIVTRANMLKLNTASSQDVLRTFFDNSQAGYTQLVSEFLRRFPPLDSIACAIESPDYSLIKHFSLLYAVEINVLLDIHKSRPEGYITVVDEATCAGSFIVTCASVLPRSVLARIRFLGTDLKLTDMIHGMEAARQYPIDVTWQLSDINASDHVAKLKAFNNGDRVDLLVLNHVLEHLENYRAEEYILAWLMAARTLIISVPFESDYETSISSHVMQFDLSSLFALGASIDKASHHQITCDTRFVGCGLLIFRHNATQCPNPIEAQRYDF